MLCKQKLTCNFSFMTSRSNVATTTQETERNISFNSIVLLSILIFADICLYVERDGNEFIFPNITDEESKFFLYV